MTFATGCNGDEKVCARETEACTRREREREGEEDPAASDHADGAMRGVSPCVEDPRCRRDTFTRDGQGGENGGGGGSPCLPGDGAGWKEMHEQQDVHERQAETERHQPWPGTRSKKSSNAYTEEANPCDRSLLACSLLLDARDHAERLWAVDVCLRSPAVAAVIVDASGFDMAATRRLQLAAESRQGALGLLVRPPHELSRLSAASTRWRVIPGRQPAVNSAAGPSTDRQDAHGRLDPGSPHARQPVIDEANPGSTGSSSSASSSTRVGSRGSSGSLGCPSAHDEATLRWCSGEHSPGTSRGHSQKRHSYDPDPSGLSHVFHEDTPDVKRAWKRLTEGIPPPSRCPPPLVIGRALTPARFEVTLLRCKGMQPSSASSGLGGLMDVETVVPDGVRCWDLERDDATGCLRAHAPVAHRSGSTTVDTGLPESRGGKPRTNEHQRHRFDEVRCDHGRFDANRFAVSPRSDTRFAISESEVGPFDSSRCEADSCEVSRCGDGADRIPAPILDTSDEVGRVDFGGDRHACDCECGAA